MRARLERAANSDYHIPTDIKLFSIVQTSKLAIYVLRKKAIIEFSWIASEIHREMSSVLEIAYCGRRV